MAEQLLPELDELAERYYPKGDYTRKGPTYLTSYARLLSNRRMDELRILELGVFSGASLLIWRDYLPNATIVGIDIAQAPERILNLERVHFLRGSQDDPEILRKAASLVGGQFDIIIDDASHIGYLTKRSLHYLFPFFLVPGGWYIIEDFGTAFIPEYPDGATYQEPAWDDAVPSMREFRSSQSGMVGFIKQLIDHLMQELMTGGRSFISMDRLIVETNIVFIEKSKQSGAPWPGPIPDFAPDLSSAETAISEASGPSLQELTEQLTAVQIALTDCQVLKEEIVGQAQRLATLERMASQWRSALTPVLWLRRLLKR